jgi:hypothetical protein
MAEVLKMNHLHRLLLHSQYKWFFPELLFSIAFLILLFPKAFTKRYPATKGYAKTIITTANYSGPGIFFEQLPNKNEKVFYYLVINDQSQNK